MQQQIYQKYFDNQSTDDNSDDELNGSAYDLTAYSIGTVVSSVVINQNKDGVLLKIDDCTPAFCLQSLAPKGDYAADTKHKCVVLDVDFENVSIIHNFPAATLSSKDIRI